MSRGLSTYQPNALPLGQTGSHVVSGLINEFRFWLSKWAACPAVVPSGHMTDVVVGGHMNDVVVSGHVNDAVVSGDMNDVVVSGHNYE